jgi:primosomal protein N' (replication factor Y) (superfamily II helicase)
VTSTRAVRIVTEVGAVDRAFDYLVTDATPLVSVGDRVRVDFNHRSVRGWVIAEVDADQAVKPVGRWLGYGPPREMLDLLAWAGERWYAPLARFLAAASPPVRVTELPVPPAPAVLDSAVRSTALDVAPGVVIVAPTFDPLALVLGAYERCRERAGSLLVLVPTEAWARRLRGRLEQRGCAVAFGEREWDRARAQWPVVVGARGAALAPTPRVAGAVVVDADDDALRSSATPTWDAATLLRERCRRDGAPLWMTSMMPSPSLLDGGSWHSVGDVPEGWPNVTVVDRRLGDPHDGALSREALDAAHAALEGPDEVAVVVVLQRLGTGRLVACQRCGELARCEVCFQGEREVDGRLECADSHAPREVFCRACGATNLRRVGLGVSTLARDVAAQLGRPVSEVTAATSADAALERVVVGTEAALTRVRRCAVVVVADFDQYLLAPRASARRAAVAAVGKAGRLVGSRREGRGTVVVQTRRGEDPVVTALRQGDVTALVDEDVATARLLDLPPFGAVAEVSGDGAVEFVAQVDGTLSVAQAGTVFTLRAPDLATLRAALSAAERPAGRLRVAVW